MSIQENIDQNLQALVEYSLQKDFLIEEFQKIANIGGWEMNLSNCELSMTQRSYSILGFSSSEKTDIERLKNLCNEESQMKLENAIKEIVTKGQDFDIELNFKNSEWIRILGEVVDNGKTQKVRGILWDISEKKRNEIELQKQYSELKRINQEFEQIKTKLKETNSELRRFTYATTHDIKAPVSIIEGYLNFLKEDSDILNERSKLAIEYIEKSVRRFNDIIRKIIDEAEGKKEQ